MFEVLQGFESLPTVLNADSGRVKHPAPTANPAPELRRCNSLLSLHLEPQPLVRRRLVQSLALPGAVQEGSVKELGVSTWLKLKTPRLFWIWAWQPG